MRLWFRKQNHPVFRCRACRVIRIAGCSQANHDQESIYQGGNAVFFKDGNESYYLDETNFWSCREKAAWLEKYVPRGRSILDAGANFGHFLKTVEGIYTARGFDIGDGAVAWSRTHLQVDNQVASLYELPAELRGPYDAVTCWDVIEHVPDPLGALHRLHEVLTPDGMLFLSTPDAGSLVAKLTGHHWHYIDPVQHQFLFGRKSLETALRRAGFAVVERRSFGHYYRCRYVFDRLAQMNEGLRKKAVLLMRRLCGGLYDRTIYLKLGDVMGIAARRQS
jgi:SAM-dependent methyltransferase